MEFDLNIFLLLILCEFSLPKIVLEGGCLRQLFLLQRALLFPCFVKNMVACFLRFLSSLAFFCFYLDLFSYLCCHCPAHYWFQSRKFLLGVGPCAGRCPGKSILQVPGTRILQDLVGVNMDSLYSLLLEVEPCLVLAAVVTLTCHTFQ